MNPLLYPLLVVISIPGGSIVLLALVVVFAREHSRWRAKVPPVPSTGASHRAWLRRGCAVAGIGVAEALGFLVGQRAIPVFVPLGACGYLAGVLLAELTIPGPPREGALRRASLRRRHLDAYMPAGAVWGWRLAAVVAVAAVIACAVASGGGGGALRFTCPALLLPWSPLGWGYGAPVLATLLAGGVLVEAMLRRIPGRARPDPAQLSTVVDDGYRAASARRALAAGYTLALTPIGTLASLAAGMLGGYCTAAGPAWATPLMWAMTVLAYAAAVGAALGVVGVLTTPDWFPPEPEPEPEPEPGGEAWT
jgi:hypothetical protein